MSSLAWLTYSEDIALTICRELASGRALTKIVKDEGMPGLTTVYKWMMENESFALAYARAREDQADTLADETMEIADQDPATTSDKDGNERVDSAAVQHQRLRVDTRKWFAAKMLPKKYGDKIDHTTGGEKLPAAGFNVYMGVTIDK